MNIISVLILFPLLAGIIILLVRNDALRNNIVRICALVTMLLTLYVVSIYFKSGLTLSFSNEHVIDLVMISAEILMAAYVIFVGIKSKCYLVALFSAIQTPLITWFELTQKAGIEVKNAIVFDKLSAIMVLVVGVIGSLICFYAVGYFKWYHAVHKEYKERKYFFFAVMFIFLSAMLGLVLSNNLTWIYFCWEVTSLCSFLLIGYTQTAEAKKNSLLALVINVGGGLAFCVAIVMIGLNYKTLELSTLISLKPEVMVLIPVFLLSLAALTKSAQLPFSAWLLGAMVAPTPSSALLHSATMVKAGVYLLIRLAPLLGQTTVGKIVTLVGGFTFLASSLMAIAQRDAKKVLAYSTIANLGLIVTCAAVGTPESIWAAILLVVFHSISKSLLFLSVGSAEHQIGNRIVDNMNVLMNLSRKLSVYMLIGIAGMFLAPFGMLISKWAAMKAFIDSKNIVIVIILVYGSAATLFYWAKWMGKLVTNASAKEENKKKFYFDEELPIFLQAVLVVVACLTFPLISKYALVPYLTGLFGKSIVPIDASDVNIMLIMLGMLLVLPIAFMPIRKNDKRRIVPIYMAGENTGDNESFYSIADTTRKAEMKNWYMEDYFSSAKLTYWSNLSAIIIMCVGVILLIGGLA